MFKLPQPVAGSLLRKIVALLLAHCFLATSTWSLNPPGQAVSHRDTSLLLGRAAKRTALANLASAGGAWNSFAPGEQHIRAVPKIFTNLRALNASIAAAQATGGATTTINFFGPQEYVRTSGDPNTYTTTVNVPAWVVSPFNLHIQNGEANGSFRVSSAVVSINNTQIVAAPSDFDQNVFTLDRSVTLTPQTTLTVTLASKPGSYLKINLSGANADSTPPTVTIAAPTSAINTPQAHFDIRYQDIVGTGEPAASGVNASTLKVVIDGTDRTSLFTKFSDEATADLPASLALAQGPHTLVASIQDNAGNTGQVSTQFQVDTTPPTLQFLQPAAGAYLSNTSPQIALAYSDNFALNVASLKVTDNGADISSAFSTTATGASGAPVLPQGGNEIVAIITDQAGNQTSASLAFNVDTTPPTITIVHPVSGSKHGSATVEYQLQYSDDQALDLNSLSVSIDGTSIVVTPTATGVSGSVTLADSSSHVLAASIKDKAGNAASGSSTFIVDTTLPNIHITQPSPSAILANSAPQIQVDYSDTISGVDTTSFKAFVDGGDITPLFLVQASSASATLQTPLADGPHTISAQIASGAGNLGVSTNSILIDTIKPQLTIASPAGPVSIATPLGIAQYSDSGSGIDPRSVHITLDGADVTGSFGVSTSSASGALGGTAGLSEGPHQLAVSVADKAGNVTQDSSSFLVDVTPPAVAFSSPTNNSFTNNTQPSFTLTYTDSGSGINLSSVHVFLQLGNAPENEITSLFTIAAGQGTATIPASAPLAAGTYHLRAVVADNAGNQSQAQAIFALDTTPPTYNIQAPAANAFLNTSTPTFTVSYQDDASGVDASKFVLLVDGVDRTNRLTVTPTGATGNLQPADALPDGTHQVSVTVIDLAGNAATVVPQSFLVDTIPPALSISAPPAAFINTNLPPISVTYSDTGSGIDVTTFQLLIDGIDVTSQFAVTLTGASGSPATALPDGVHSIVATVKDLAGNVTTVNSSFTVDTTPLTLSVNQPATGTFTNANSITVSGTATGFPPVTVTVDGVNVPVSGNSFATDVPLGAGPSQIIHVAASDPSGASTSSTTTVNIDRVSPTIIGSISPAPNGAGWNNTGISVNFVCSDDSSGVASCTSPVSLTSEGANQVVTGTAVDKAGNTTSTSVTVNIDTTPPLIAATAAPPAVNGWNNGNVTVSFTCTDNLSGVASCPPPAIVATEGQNQPVAGQATDIAGNVAQAAISLSIDKTAPTILLSAPDHISALHPGQVSATVTDNFTVAQVVFSVNGASLGTFTTAPYQATVQVPAGASPGDTLTVTAVATDQAGNTQTASRAVSVTADGVIVGQVLSDVTGLPIQGASVQLISATGQSDQTDAKGRYSFQASDTHLFVSATNIGTTTVEREIFVQPGQGTVAVDARLTPLSAPVPVGAAGGALTAGLISISVPAAAVPDGTSFQLTSLSGQGLPGLLPLGWSPLAAFDLRSSTSTPGLPAVVSKLPNVAMHLVTYNSALHAWTMVVPSLQPANGAVSFTVPAAGAYALVVPDTTTPPLPVPDLGNPLTGIPMQPIDPSASSSGSLNPAMLPPAGGTAIATLGLQSPSFAPSGTIVQANVSETFSLSSGDVVSEETRSEDILLYNALAPANSAMGALFPVTPSHQYTLTQLVTGKVHLDILSGREAVRGQPGGNDPLTTSDGVATLSIPGGALTQDTAISVESTPLETFVPTSGSMSAIQEVLVDFSGEMLNTPAQLSIPATGLNPSDTFLLTQVQRINGVPHVVAVALAQISGTSLISAASPGLPGVTQGGEYVFYDISVPVGFVEGVTSSSAGPISALVLTDSLPIAGISGANGQYIVPALIGTANLRASAPNTLLAGTASAQVLAGQTVAANILLSGTVTSATITPADGTLGVSTGTIITITTSAPLNPQSITQSNLSVFQGPPSAPGAPVTLQPFILSASGTTLTFAPVTNLAPATQYTVKVSGLADVSGGAISVPVSSFTTLASAPLNFDPNAITFAFPDQNGNIHVSAPAGSLPAGTKIAIIDQSNAVVLSLTALNDGSVSGDFPGTINDVLQVTVTDPNGATITFTRSQFVAADGTTAVGPGGGTVTGPGGVELRIPQGALDKAASFKIEAFGPDLFVDRPDLPGGTFGAGLKITSPDQPVFKKEVKLAFPRPTDAPAGSFFQAYRRMQGPNGQFAFENLDYALEEGTGATAKVVTASFPFSGYQTSYDAYILGGTFGAPAVQAGLDSFVFLMWTFDQTRPGISLGGAITGRLRYAIAPGGVEPDGTINRTGDTAFVGVPNVLVSVDVNSSTHALGSGVTTAITQQDGTFTFSDPAYSGGTINVVAYAPTGTVTASAIEAVSLTDQTINTFAGPLLKFYRNVAFADMVATSPVPPPPAPQINIGLFKEVPDPSDPTGVKTVLQAQTGLLTAETPFIVGFQSNGAISAPPGVTINGVSYASMPATDAHKGTIEFELTDQFTPATAGIYQIVATGLTTFAQSIKVSKSFMAVAAGGNNNSIQVGKAPIIASVTPAAASTGVPVDSFVQVQFSEPVTNLPGNVSLVPDDGSAPPALKLSGIDYQNGTPIASLGPADAVASLTIQPVSGLKFGMHYTLKVSTAVVDLDNVADPTQQAQHLIPPEGQNPPQPPFDFTTFGPQVLGGTQAFSSTRPVVLGERAYVAVPGSANSQVNSYDISDPANPVQITSSTAIVTGRASDIAGQESSGVAGGDNLLAVATGVGATEFGLPANLWLFDTSGDQLKRIGAVSVTSSTVNVGQILRVTVAGDFAYTSTFPVGINVVDLQQAVSEYNQVFSTNPEQFGQQITTDGEGFANDAVISTIPVQDSTGRNVMLLDIKAGDLPVAGSDPQNPTLQRIVVATGSAPGSTSPNPVSFVVADPALSGTSALLYHGSLQLNGSSLTAGTAVALGQLTDSIADANGNLIQRQVAVVVGRGAAPDPANPGQTISGGMLAVVDMTVPSSPAVLGILTLPTFPTDVVLSGATALVGTGENEVLLVSLADLRNPTNAGVVKGSAFGDRLALTKDGVLLGTSFDSTHGGIQSAVFRPVVVIRSVASIVAQLVSGDPTGQSSTPVFQLTSNATIMAQIVPPDPNALSGTVSFGLGSSTVQSSLAYANSIALQSIPAGTRVTGNTITATASAVNPQRGTINGLPAKVGVGTATLQMDFNNDTDVNGTDIPLKKTNAVAFWASEPPQAPVSISDLAPRENLLDYLVVRINSTVPVPRGSLQLRLISPTGDTWYLADKIVSGKSYLQNDDASVAEAGWIAQGCQPNSDQPMNLGGECSASSDPLPLPQLAQGQNEFLFRCLSCAKVDTSAFPLRKLQLIQQVNGSPVVLDEVMLDIRLIREWMGAYTARSPLGDTPASTLTQVNGWQPISPDATTITVLIHGFHVDEAHAEQVFLPSMFKRLYWSQYPVFSPQGSTQTVGITWPGDAGAGGLLMFPTDEFRAFEVGVPLARFFAQYAGKKFKVFAHSLGNLVMNSALQRAGTPDGFPDGVVPTYVMNDAALPAEVFSNGYIPAADENSFFLSHAQANGYPDDQVWQKEWSDMQQGLPLVLCGLQPCNDFTNLNNWNNTLNSPSYTTAPKPQYFCRWRQQRPVGGLPDSAPSGNPSSTTCDEQRGPWRGFFQGNLAHTTIINTFNPGDGVLVQAWAREQKGLHGNKNFLSVVSTFFSAVGLNDKADDPSVQYWASFPFADASQESLWSGGTHSNLIRQWGELAYWFPTLSYPAGSRDLSGIGIQSQSFAALAPQKPAFTDLLAVPFTTPNAIDSHTYLYTIPYSHVYPAFQILKADFSQ